MTKEGLFVESARLYGKTTGRARYYAEMAEYNERDVQATKAVFDWAKGLTPAEQAARKAIAGGLQAHSVGGSYPLHPVYIANGDSGHWEVHNLQTGQKLYHWLTVTRPWRGDAQMAIDWAADASDGTLDDRYFAMH